MRAVCACRDVSRQIPSLGGFGAWCAQRRIEDALRVVAAKSQRLNYLESGGAAGTAEATASGCGLAAVCAGVECRSWGRRKSSPPSARGGGEVERVQRTMIRRVAAT